MNKAVASGLLALAAVAVLASSLLFPGEPVWAGSAGGDFNLPDTAHWAAVLDAHAVDGGVDYSSLSGDRDDLDAYLRAIGEATPQGAPADKALAFWINSYNAAVLSLVLEHYPEIDSVKDVPGFFDELETMVGSEVMTLDEIEGRALESGDPRVHFAVVCASHSCPDLRSDPYTSDRLEEQLEEQTTLFLANREKGARLDDGSLWLSSLFKWYGGDFTGGSDVVAYLSRGKVMEWVVQYLPEETAEAVIAESAGISYLDYDWSLNDRRR